MKIIIVLLVLLISISCILDIEQVENPEKETTLEILNQPRQEAEIVIYDSKLYVIQDGVIKYITIQKDKNYDLVHFGVLFGFVLLLFLGYLDIMLTKYF